MMTQTYSRPHYCGCPTRPYLMENGAPARLLYIDGLAEEPISGRLTWRKSVQSTAASLQTIADQMDKMIIIVEETSKVVASAANARLSAQLKANLMRFKKRCKWVSQRLNAANEHRAPALLEQAEALKEGVDSLRQKVVGLHKEMAS